MRFADAGHGMEIFMDYFVESYGSAGYVDFSSSNFTGLKRWYRLYDYPRSLTAALIDKIAEQARKENREFDLIHHCFDALPKGIVVNGCGVLGMPFAEKDSFSAGNLLDRGGYEKAMEEAYACFFRAKKNHDEWEQIYIQKTDFALLNRLAEQVSDKLIGSRYLPKTGTKKDRFFGSATVSGAKDYIAELTENVEKRYFIKGRPGTGKSTFLRKIAEYALSRGFDTEIYHCAFDPASLDMILFRELGLCLFDSTSPHEYFPSREKDEVIDIYQIAVAPGTDEDNGEQIALLSSSYQKEMKEATEHISEAKQCLDQADEKLLSLLDPILIEKTEQQILKGIFDR